MIREFPKTRGTLFGVLIIRILLFRVLYWGPLFSETPIQRNICGGIIFSFGNWTSGSADHPKPLNPKPLTLSSAFIGSEELCLTTTHADSSCQSATLRVPSFQCTYTNPNSRSYHMENQNFSVVSDVSNNFEPFRGEPVHQRRYRESTR